MKFFIACTIFVIHFFYFTLLLLFIFKSPEIYPISSLTQKSREEIEEMGLNYEDVNQKSIAKSKYIMGDYKAKQDHVMFLSFMTLIVNLCVNLILFFRKSYIILPIVTSSSVSMLPYLSIWFFPNVFSEKFLYDLYIISEYDIFKKSAFLVSVILTELIVILFSRWYKI